MAWCTLKGGKENEMEQGSKDGVWKAAKGERRANKRGRTKADTKRDKQLYSPQVGGKRKVKGLFLINRI